MKTSQLTLNFPQDDDEAAAAREKERQRLEAAARQEQETIDTIMASGRLFVRNLPFAASEDELEAHFAQWGEVEQVSVWLQCLGESHQRHRVHT